MHDKYSADVLQLMSILTKIAVLIEDNNQNIKDCKNILDEIFLKININKKMSMREKIKKLFFG